MPFGSAKFYGFLLPDLLEDNNNNTHTQNNNHNHGNSNNDRITENNDNNNNAARTIKLTTTTITTSNKNLREDHDNVVGLSGLKQGAVHDETVSKKIPKHQ